jgi:hypothetical protein
LGRFGRWSCWLSALWVGRVSALGGCTLVRRRTSFAGWREERHQQHYSTKSKPEFSEKVHTSCPRAEARAPRASPQSGVSSLVPCHAATPISSRLGAPAQEGSPASRRRTTTCRLRQHTSMAARSTTRPSHLAPASLLPPTCTCLLLPATHLPPPHTAQPTIQYRVINHAREAKGS